MKFSASEDDRLIEFLRANRPEIPPPAVDLEARVMLGIPQLKAPPSAPRRRLWVIPMGAVAATILGAIASYTLLKSPQPTNVETLEAFLEQSWQGVLSTPESTDSADFLFFDSPSHLNTN